MWRDELAANLALCERIAVPDGKPTSFDVVVTYGSGFGSGERTLVAAASLPFLDDENWPDPRIV